MSITDMSATPDRGADDSLPIGGPRVTPEADDGSTSVQGVGGAGRGHLDAVPAVRRYPSPVGELVLIAVPSGLAAVLWPGDERPVRVGSGLDARSLVAESAAVRTAIDVAVGDDPLVREPSAASVAGSTGGAADPAQVLLAEAARQLDEYFAGTRHSFDLPLDPVGTEFQVSVWRSLADIGYGETSTYGEQAERLGRPTAVRAVGAANGRNPLSIVLPCHRVVGRDGRLTGFAGGLEAKAFLLEHEARHRPR